MTTDRTLAGTPFAPVLIVADDAVMGASLAACCERRGLPVRVAEPSETSGPTGDEVVLIAVRGRVPTLWVEVGRRTYALLDRRDRAGFTAPPGVTARVDVAASPEDLVRALVGRGGPALLHDGDEPLDRTSASPVVGLTARETQVLRELVEGGSDAVIGDRLGISANTVRTHVQNLLPKLGVHSRLEAATLAMDAGLAGPLLAGVA